jgi:hypothetical protein
MSSHPLRPQPAWAHSTGVLVLPARPPRVQLSIRDQLVERLHWYCWAFDERQPELLEDCFTADAVWQGYVMGETDVGPHVGRNAVMRYLTDFWIHQRDQRRHVISNVVVEHLDDDSATCLAYLLLMGSRRGHTQFECAGFYQANFRNDTGSWRISRLTAGFDSPYWKQPVEEMEPWVRDLFGITRHEPPSADV